MDNNFSKVKNYLLELECSIIKEDTKESLFIIEKEDSGIKNMIVDCEDSILVIEQFLCDLPKDDATILKSLLMKNREIVHGAFVLDNTGKKLIFRDTLPLENLDKNELESTLNSLSLLLTEYGVEILRFCSAK